jgi:TRAP-type C4-dicarboxylate transport system permease small subunit
MVLTSPSAAEETPPSRLPPVLAAVVAVLDRVAAAVMLVSGAMMVLLIAIFGWLVFGRYVLNDTPTWVEQLALLLIVWITFLGAAVGVWRSSHLSIDFIREAMPGGIRHALRLLTDVALAGFGATMAWYGTALTLGMSRRTVQMLGVSEGWRAAPIAICGVLIVLFALASLAIRIAGHHRMAGD